ncbi:MAG: molybdate ABC transporter substrate-binding protein [Puniceicoccaceae bacterium]
MPRFLLSLLVALAASSLLSSCVQHPSAGVLRIAAASNIKFALETLLEGYAEKPNSVLVAVTYGSSGNLRAQIAQGAPFDLFLSADLALPEQLIKMGQADADSLVPYAVGRLVIWVPNSSPIEVDTLKERALLAPEARKIAIANPDHAPYGRAAVAALTAFGILEEVAPRFVLSENIAQASQFVESGAADIGVLALSLAVAPAMEKKGRYWEIPMEKFPAIVQGGVVVSASKQKQQAGEILALLQSDHGREVLVHYGFHPSR